MTIYSLKHSLKPEFEYALKLIISVTDSLHIPYFIAGATARDLILYYVFGRDPGRQTRDIDTAILVANWEEYRQVKSSLTTAGLVDDGAEHRLREPKSGLPIDIIPFGLIGNENNEIQWPPEHEVTMSVVGFQEAYDSAILVDIGSDTKLKVASLAGIALLKLIAWLDRGIDNNKDATDFLKIIDQYQYLQEDRMWEDFIPAESLNHQMERKGAFILGYDLNAILTTKSTESLSLIRNEHFERFLNSLVRIDSGMEPDVIEELLEDFWLGVQAH